MTNPNAPFSQFSGKVLRRSRTQRMLSGVSGGIAEYFNIDVTLVRLGIVGLTVITGGTALLGYVAAWVIIPDSDGSTVYPPAQQPAQPTDEADIAARIYDDPKPPAA